MAAVKNPSEIERLRVFGEMLPATAAVAKKLEERKAMLTKNSLGLFWLMGGDAKAAANKDGEAKYGVDAIGQIASYLNYSAGWIHAAIACNTAYSKEQIVKMAAQQMSNGDFLTTEHLRLLSQIEKASVRNTLLTRTLTESLPAIDMKAVIEDLPDSARSKFHRKGGRTPTAPKTPLAAANQIYTETSRLQNRIEGWERVLLDTDEDMTADDIDTVLTTRIDKATSAVETLTAALANFETRLSKLRDHCESLVAANVADSKAADRNTKGKADKAKAKANKANDVKAAKATPVAGKATKADSKPSPVVKLKAKVKPAPEPEPEVEDEPEAELEEAPAPKLKPKTIVKRPPVKTPVEEEPVEEEPELVEDEVDEDAIDDDDTSFDDVDDDAEKAPVRGEGE